MGDEVRAELCARLHELMDHYLPMVGDQAFLAVIEGASEWEQARRDAECAERRVRGLADGR